MDCHSCRGHERLDSTLAIQNASRFLESRSVRHDAQQSRRKWRRLHQTVWLDGQQTLVDGLGASLPDTRHQTNGQMGDDGTSLTELVKYRGDLGVIQLRKAVNVKVHPQVRTAKRRRLESRAKLILVVYSGHGRSVQR